MTNPKQQQQHSSAQEVKERMDANDTGGTDDNSSGYDLRLMSVSATEELIEQGCSLVIVARVGGKLHIRIFDAGGEKVVDKAEGELDAGKTFTALKQRLTPLPDDANLSQQDKQEIIDKATSIAGHTLSPVDETSLDCQLKDLEDQLLVQQQQIKIREVEIAESQEQIKTLTALIGEIGGVIDNYKERHRELQEKENCYKKFCDDEKASLSGFLGDDPPKVCTEARAVMDEIVGIGVEIEKLEVGCGDEKGDLDKAKRLRTKKEMDLAKAKMAFDAWKNPVKAIEVRFKDLEKLKKEISAEHEAQSYAMAYYLLIFGTADCGLVKKEYQPCEVAIGDQEFFESFEKYWSRANHPPKVVDPTLLKEKISEAWKNYKEADAAYNEQDAEVKKLEKKLELLKSQAAEKKKNFEATIRRKLSELNQAQPSAA